MPIRPYLYTPDYLSTLIDRYGGPAQVAYLASLRDIQVRYSAVTYWARNGLRYASVTSLNIIKWLEAHHHGPPTTEGLKSLVYHFGGIAGTRAHLLEHHKVSITRDTIQRWLQEPIPRYSGASMYQLLSHDKPNYKSREGTYRATPISYHT